MAKLNTTDVQNWINNINDNLNTLYVIRKREFGGYRIIEYNTGEYLIGGTLREVHDYCVALLHGINLIKGRKYEPRSVVSNPRLIARSW